MILFVDLGWANPCFTVLLPVLQNANHRPASTDFSPVTKNLTKDCKVPGMVHLMVHLIKTTPDNTYQNYKHLWMRP